MGGKDVVNIYIWGRGHNSVPNKYYLISSPYSDLSAVPLMPLFPVDPASKFVVSLECLLSETASQLVLRKKQLAGSRGAGCLRTGKLCKDLLRVLGSLSLVLH